MKIFEKRERKYLFLFEINLLYENNIECSDFNDLCCKSLGGKVIERHSDDGSLFYAISEEE